MDHLNYISVILVYYKFPTHRADYEWLCYGWIHLQAGRGSPTDKIMASSGSMPAWIAYRQSLAKVAPENRTNFAGKENLMVHIRALQSADEGVQKRVANGLKVQLSHEEVRWNKRLKKFLRARCSQSPYRRPCSPLNNGSLGITQQVRADIHRPVVVQAASTSDSDNTRRKQAMLPTSTSSCGHTGFEPLTFSNTLHRRSPVPLLPPLLPSGRSPYRWPAFSTHSALNSRAVMSSEVINGSYSSRSPALLPPSTPVSGSLLPSPTAQSTANPRPTRVAELLNSPSTAVQPMQPESNPNSLVNQSNWIYLAFANAEEAERLLPPALANILVRIPYPHRPGNAVDITMAYPGTTKQKNGPQCQISFEILAQHLGQVVQDLFSAQLVRNGSSQYIIASGGLQTIPCPRVMLRGANPAAVRRLFGWELYLNMAYCEREGQCPVWMLISENASEKATLSICVFARAASNLRERLYSE